MSRGSHEQKHVEERLEIVAACMVDAIVAAARQVNGHECLGSRQRVRFLGFDFHVYGIIEINEYSFR